jgi:hypothetical protein
MPRCAGIKRDGARCTAIVAPSATYCYHHAPHRAQERRRNASRGGRSKGSGSEIVDLKRQLRELAAAVLSGKVERADAAVVNQILNTRARLIGLERKIREQEELKERLEALEDVLKMRRPG